MGTNYYMMKGEHFPEYKYNHPLNGFLKRDSGQAPAIHVGKSSGGWCFSLHVYPGQGIKTLADWKDFATRLTEDGWRVEDEYGFIIELDELWRIIERVGMETWRDGNPLSRHNIDGHTCIGHGDGLYDYIIGEFS